eukprot:s373_g15.t1
MLLATAKPASHSRGHDVVWRSNKLPVEKGVVVLGTPIEHRDFVRQWAAKRMSEQNVPLLPDLQFAIRGRHTPAAYRNACAKALLVLSATCRCLAALEKPRREGQMLPGSGGGVGHLQQEEWRDCFLGVQGSARGAWLAADSSPRRLACVEEAEEEEEEEEEEEDAVA